MTRTKSATPTAKPAAKKTALSAPPLTNLTEEQVHMCDLAADLLTCGGQPELFGRLVYLLLQHEYARRVQTRNMDPQELSKKMKEYASDKQPQNAALKARLMNAWQAPIPDAKEPMPEHVRSIAAVNIRAQLRSEFGFFLGRAEFDSLWLLGDVLQAANSGENLAEAFHYRFRDGGCFVKVPRKHEERVLQFLGMLNGTEGKAA